MLTIRLSRIGKKNHPQYRIVLQEKIKSPKGKHITTLGYYHPVEKKLEIEKGRIEQYIATGARPSSTVAKLLQKQGMIGMEKYIETKHKKSKQADKNGTPAVAAETPAAAAK